MFLSSSNSIIIVSPIISSRWEDYFRSIVNPSQSDKSINLIIISPVGFTPSTSQLQLAESFSNVIVLSETYSASEARNLCLSHAKALIAQSDWSKYYIWFADDDCSLPPYDPFKTILLDSQPCSLYLYRLCDPISKRLVGKYLSNDSLLKKYSYFFYGAPSIVCSLDSTVAFDTRLGPGTSLFSAEDTEFLIKIFSVNPNISFRLVDDFLYHPYLPLSQNKIHNYGVGQGFLFRMVLYGYY